MEITRTFKTEGLAVSSGPGMARVFVLNNIPFLIGLGLEILSVTAPGVPAVKQVIRSVDSNWARALSKTGLTLNSTEKVNHEVHTSFRYFRKN